jgi:hypothetical protein
MNYPGRNKIEFSDEALKALVAQHLAKLGDSIRILDVTSGYAGFSVSFTSDPAPTFSEPKEAPIIVPLPTPQTVEPL